MGRDLLGERSQAIRQATLRVIGELGSEGGAEMVLDVLQKDRDPTIRRLAVDALGKTGGMVYYQTLYDYTKPANEADPEVREAAWQALRAALPRGSVQQLSNTAQLFKGDPDRRVFVYQILAERLRQQGKMADWAQQLQNLADEELNLKTPRRSEAAAHYDEALKYWLENGGDPLTIEDLTTKVVQARLAAGQYALAASFAQSAIARQKEAAQEVGRVIKNEADRLRNLATPADYRSANALIEAALKMNPPLDPRHQNDLKQIRSDIEAATGAGGSTPAGRPAPAGAGGAPDTAQ
jgi:tetratricopeptide (TPR) repeat protein